MSSYGFLLQQEGRNGLVAIFEDDGETGWLYLFNPEIAESDENGIVACGPAYNRGNLVQPREQDVWVAWSVDFTKCAVLVRGRGRPIIDDFRVVIDVNSRRVRHRLWDGNSLGIDDIAWLQGFEWTWQHEATK